jgi:hypothetical protein
MIFHIVRDGDISIAKSLNGDDSIAELYSGVDIEQLFYRETLLNPTKLIKSYFPYDIKKIYIYDRPISTFKSPQAESNTMRLMDLDFQLTKLKAQVCELQQEVLSERRIQRNMLILGTYLFTIVTIPLLF